MAILRNKAEALHIELAEDVLVFSRSMSEPMFGVWKVL
jgi:hypothetical protein